MENKNTDITEQTDAFISKINEMIFKEFNHLNYLSRELPITQKKDLFELKSKQLVSEIVQTLECIFKRYCDK